MIEIYSHHNNVFCHHRFFAVFSLLKERKLFDAKHQRIIGAHYINKSFKYSYCKYSYGSNYLFEQTKE